MKLPNLHRSGAWPVAALVTALLLVAFVAFVPHLGFAKATPAALWTEQTTARPVAGQAPDWVQLAKALKPAVVNISAKRVQEATPPMPSVPGNPPLDEFFKQFFGRMPRHTVRSLGSGFIISPDGHIVTNNHVVDEATEIMVKLGDGREFPAKVVGRDPKTDIALLKIDATGLPVIPLGDSAQLQVGEPVMAIGNPFGLEQTVTTGIVSATGRVIGEGPYDDFIQTDASINPGNSGGPLISAQGQAIGINAAIVSQSGGSIGIGFAIPINVAKWVVPQLAETGHVVRGWLGVTIQPLTAALAKSFNLPNTHGALVASVLDGSPASQAGLKAGDVITEYDGREVARTEELPRAVAQTPVGREVPLTVVRDGKTVTLTAKIVQLPESEARPAGESSGSPTLGLAVQSVTPEVAKEFGLSDRRGVLVRGVRDDSPAASAGLRPGDVIVEMDRHSIRSVEDMKRVMALHEKGKPVLFLVHRSDGSLYLAAQG
ncbi:MAG: DegQ family serine endoprotease [Candidatus Rokubacteria bacterium]|nr:DegQ family serine endoprotease [Candidatus Rokubacteria bacterium]